VPKVTVRGMDLNVVRLGAGPPTLVFLHGLIVDNLTSFCYTLAAAAAEHCEAICYDQRGHGRSDRPSTGYAPKDGADDLAALLDELHVEGPVYLCGNSYASVVQFEFARRYPQRLAGLCIIEGHLVRAGWGEQMLDTMDMGFWALYEPDAREWLKLHQTRKIRQQVQATEALVFETSLMADLRYAPVTDLDQLATLRCPVLLIYGEYSDIFEVGQLLAATIPTTEMRVVRDCGHSVLQQKTEVARDHLVEWLLRQKTAASTASPVAASDGTRAAAGAGIEIGKVSETEGTDVVEAGGAVRWAAS
jgi:pimeloyl-ACP methyl ester carboxylesterase